MNNNGLNKMVIVKTNVLTDTTKTFIPKGMVGRVIDYVAQTGHYIVDFGLVTVCRLSPDDPLIEIVDVDIAGLRTDVNRLVDEVADLDKKLADLGQRMAGGER